MKKLLTTLSGLVLFFMAALPADAQSAAPFKWHAGMRDGKLEVAVNVPERHYLYQASTSVSARNASGKELKLLSFPKSIEHNDAFSGKTVIYPGGHEAIWVFQPSGGAPYSVEAKSQGCRDSSMDSPAVCFMPETKFFSVGAWQGKISSPGLDSGLAAGKIPDSLLRRLEKMRIERVKSGYMNAREFTAFLTADASGGEDEDVLSGRSVWLIILFVLLGGLGLNLTPCVLPMIPVNLAIIGAGAGASSKRRGFLLGGAYGLGIALAYGVLGLASAFAGAKFGSLNSTVWFNLVIAGIFLALGLAMFDLFSIDLSRYGAKAGPGKNRGPVLTAFFMGIVAALLAGACVAPVVIAVLLYAGRLVSGGSYWGLALPFLLGIGMGLPWPFAGAGMAVIPRPGRWMVRVKYIFGTVIIIAAAYYAYLGFSLIKSDSTIAAQFEKLNSALAVAEKERKPVMIDFWATWCKNCSRMEKTTFKDPEVKNALKNFITVKFQAENPDDPETFAAMNYFKVPGLPTFVILRAAD